MFDKILTVCTGNLCRSPMAEALLRHRSNRNLVRASSAGLSARVGAPAEAHAIAILSQHGVDLSGHRARQLEPSDVLAADLVLVMERWQKTEVERLCPAARGRTYLLAHWQGTEIFDPMGGNRAIFEDVYLKISGAIDAWLERLH